ncbi:MAG: acyl carrier protein [Myxococcales bacterium]|nr:acyl carrier protein [Myxococcales bacterium]
MPDDILARLIDQAALRFGEPARELAPGDDLFDKLGIDSLQALDLLTDLEEAFAIEIPDWEVQGVHTLDGLADVIRRRL